jgi:hypothetical protein
MATSPNCAVPASRHENRRAKSSILDSVSNQADVNATNSAGYETAENIRNLLFELGVEPSLTVQEAAAILRWSYWKARRYFSQVDGICVSYHQSATNGRIARLRSRSAFSLASGKR